MAQKPLWFDPWHPFTYHQPFLAFNLNIVHHT